jgi:hypothetical protein
MRRVLDGCPDDERLAELAHAHDAAPLDESGDELGDEPREALADELRAHLDGCAPCRARLAEERRDARLLAELRGVARRPGPPAISGYAVEG